MGMAGFGRVSLGRENQSLTPQKMRWKTADSNRKLTRLGGEVSLAFCLKAGEGDSMVLIELSFWSSSPSLSPYFLQKAGVKRMSAVKISMRPSSMAAIRTQV